MEFEYDPGKSAENARKHGIDFEAAQHLWYDPQLLTAAARTEDEARFIAVGKIGDKYWTAIYTYRGDAVRIISVRRARREEIVRYEGL
jgi:uncharacterized DUF497 family protein